MTHTPEAQNDAAPTRSSTQGTPDVAVLLNFALSYASGRDALTLDLAHDRYNGRISALGVVALAWAIRCAREGQTLTPHPDVYEFLEVDGVRVATRLDRVLYGRQEVDVNDDVMLRLTPFGLGVTIATTLGLAMSDNLGVTTARLQIDNLDLSTIDFSRPEEN